MSVRPRLFVAAGAVMVLLLLLLLGGRASSFGPPPVDTWVVSGGQFGDGTVESVAVNGSTAYLGGIFGYIGPETGSLVSVAAPTGALTTPWPTVGGQVYAVAPDGAGGWFIGGSFSSVGAEPVQNLAHIEADGTLDTGWTVTLDGPVYALAVSGTTVYAAGAFIVVGTDDMLRRDLVAFDRSTGATTSFDPDVVPDLQQNSVLYALELSGTTLYVGGGYVDDNVGFHSKLAAVDTTTPTGTLTAWAPTANGFIDTLAVGANGTVYVGGAFDTVTGGTPRDNAAAFDASGAVTAWSPDPHGEVHALEVAGSTVYLGGEFLGVGEETRRGLAAVDATTGALTGWDPSVGGAVYSLAVAGTTVYAGGRFQKVGAGTNRDNLAAFGTSGTGTPTSFSPVIAGDVTALAVAGSTVVVGGRFDSAGGADAPSLAPVRRPNLGAIDLTTGRPTTWHASVDDGGVFALAVAGPSLIVGGDFSRVNGATVRINLASFSLDTSAVTSWNPVVVSRVLALAVSGTTVYAGGQITSVNGSKPRHGVAAFPTTGDGTALDWAPDVNFNVHALDTIGGTIYLGGDFTAVSGVQRLRLAAVDPSGTLTDWDPGANDTVYSLAHVGSTVYAGGGFTTAGGLPRPGVAAFEAGGTGTPTSWNPRIGLFPTNPARVFALAPTASTMVLAGDLRTVGDCATSCFLSPGVAAVSLATGEPLTTWRPAADNYVWTLRVAPQGLVIGGGFSALGATAPGYAPDPVGPDISNRGGFGLVRALPDAPGVTATPGDGSATVTVEPPAYLGGAAIDSYTVTASPGGATMSGPTGPFTFTGLANGATYTFSATATTGAGTGPAAVSAPVVPVAIRAEAPPPPDPAPRPEVPAARTLTTPRPPLPRRW